MEILYRYATWDFVDDATALEVNHGHKMLSRRELYFASQCELNDPFEDGLVPIPMDEKTLSDLQKFTTLINKPETAISEAAKSAFDAAIAGKIFFSSLSGILSFSKRRDSVLMWSHYADRHRGYCVGFDKEKLETFLVANRERLSAEVHFRSVYYVDEIPMINLQPHEGHLVESCRYKHEDWRYEKEVRAIVVNKGGLKIQIPDNCIVEVIAGHRMGTNRMREISRIIDSMDSKPLFLRAQTKFDFRLDFEPAAGHMERFPG